MTKEKKTGMCKINESPRQPQKEARFFIFKFALQERRNGGSFSMDWFFYTFSEFPSHSKSLPGIQLQLHEDQTLRKATQKTFAYVEVFCDGLSTEIFVLSLIQEPIYDKKQTPLQTKHHQHITWHVCC